MHCTFESDPRDCQSRVTLIVRGTAPDKGCEQRAEIRHPPVTHGTAEGSQLSAALEPFSCSASRLMLHRLSHLIAACVILASWLSVWRGAFDTSASVPLGRVQPEADRSSPQSGCEHTQTANREGRGR